MESSGSGAGRLSRRKSLQERLGLGLGCCGGPTWGSRTAAMSVQDDDDYDEEEMGQVPVEAQSQAQAQQQIEIIGVGPTQSEVIQEPNCINHPPPAVASPGMSLAVAVSPGMNLAAAAASPGMNLAAALAAERYYREVQDIVTVNEPNPRLSSVRPSGPSDVETGTPLRVSLLRLLEESDGLDENEKKGGEVGNDQICCVCMVRKKGAAFIPCGHTFCRVCSRELWLNRGSCPLCNRSTLEILDIF